MKKLKFLIPFLVVIIASTYSYMWLVAAENIRSVINKEVDQAKDLGIIVEIGDYKYSSFPFAVSITPQQSTLLLNNSINGKSYLVRLPDVSISCNITLRTCSSSIEPGSKIEIVEKELKTPLYEIKFMKGLKAVTTLSKSYLLAYLIEKNIKRENLVQQLGLDSSEIVISNLVTNQEVSNIKNLMLKERFNFTDLDLPLSSVKFGFEMTNTPDTGFYLSQAFNKFVINANIDNFHLQDRGASKTKEVKINEFSCTLDKSSIDTKGKIILGHNSLPQALELNFMVNNYDYLIHRGLQFSSPYNSLNEEEKLQLIKKIAEKVTNAPYDTGQATFTVTASHNNSANVMIGNASLNEILQMTLGQYRRSKK